MDQRRRLFGTAVGSFLVGGVTVGLALGAAGALPETDGGIALGALLVFPFFFRVVFGFLFLALIFRFITARRSWWGGGPPWAYEGDPSSRMDEWHRRAHSTTGSEIDDQNATGEVDSRR